MHGWNNLPSCDSPLLSGLQRSDLFLCGEGGVPLLTAGSDAETIVIQKIPSISFSLDGMSGKTWKWLNKSMAETQAKLLVLWTLVWNWKLGGIIGYIYYRGVEKFKKMNYVSCSAGPFLVLVHCIKIVMNGYWNPQLLLAWISRSYWFLFPVIFTASISITAMRVLLIRHRKAFLFLQIHFECASKITKGW